MCSGMFYGTAENDFLSFFFLLWLSALYEQKVEQYS